MQIPEVQKSTASRPQDMASTCADLEDICVHGFELGPLKIKICTPTDKYPERTSFQKPMESIHFGKLGIKLCWRKPNFAFFASIFKLSANKRKVKVFINLHTCL